MKRPRTWLRWLLIVCTLLLAVEYAILTWLAPQHLLERLRRVVGGELIIDHARLSFPLTTRLSGIRFAHNTPDFALTIHHAIIKPRFFSVPARTIELESLDLERPFLRVTRTNAGTLLWPSLTSTLPSHATFRQQLQAWMPVWNIHVRSVKVSDGVLEYIDETPTTPFHVIFDHLSLDLGPISLPFHDDQPSFALRGTVGGHSVQAAPVYCSGWIGPVAQNLQISCQLEPLALALFEPYAQRSAVIRFYNMTLKLTSQWMARANAFEARMQLELGNLSEGDLSVRGRTILDVRKLTASGEPRLSGEIRLNGPLNQPHDWSGQFTPGDEAAQKLMNQLLERKIKVLKIPFLGGRMKVRIAPATETAMMDIQAVSKEISEALDILATPVVYHVPVDVPLPNVAPLVPLSITPETKFAPETTSPDAASSNQSEATGTATHP